MLSLNGYLHSSLLPPPPPAQIPLDILLNPLIRYLYQVPITKKCSANSQLVRIRRTGFVLSLLAAGRGASLSCARYCVFSGTLSFTVGPWDNDHRMARTIANSIVLAAKRQVWQRMTQRVIRPSCRQSVDSLNRQNGIFRKSSHFGKD